MLLPEKGLLLRSLSYTYKSDGNVVDGSELSIESVVRVKRCDDVIFCDTAVT